MIDVKSIVNSKKEEIKKVVSKYPKGSIKLSIVQVGDNPASNAYVKGKLKDCKEVGIVGDLHKFDESVKPIVVLELIKQLNKDSECAGIIVQLPLPEQFTKEWQELIINEIDVYKDVDGFKQNSPYIPCTPKGVMSILEQVMAQRKLANLNGQVACVIGRSDIVGKPMVKLLIERGCTVISCNSHTKNLENWLNQADIIITAVGKRKLLNPNQNVQWRDKIVIDVGINRDENGKLCGDCSKELYNIVDLITPVPGGVGLMTRVSLLENVVETK